MQGFTQLRAEPFHRSTSNWAGNNCLHCAAGLGTGVWAGDENMDRGKRRKPKHKYVIQIFI